MTKNLWFPKATLVAALLLTMVGTMALAQDGVPNADQPAVGTELAAHPEGKLTLEGTVMYNDLEGGFYSVDGWGLIGDESLFKSLAGRRVTVQGTEFTGISTRMVKQIEVELVSEDLQAHRPLPTVITFGGKAITFDQRPLVRDGILMVPLRFVVQAAGGTVEWDPRERMVTVTMPDRMAWFKIGAPEAEMAMNNVRYIRQNMLPMATPPVIENGRTLVSADVLSVILGLRERPDGDTALDLLSGF